jgi:hypothetical protein
MGFMANSKAVSMQQKAQAAWTGGAWFFTPVLNFPAFKLGFSGNVEDWSPMMEAIMSVGWRLHTWAVVQDNKGQPQAMPLFVRPQS